MRRSRRHCRIEGWLDGGAGRLGRAHLLVAVLQSRDQLLEEVARLHGRAGRGGAPQWASQ